MAKNVNKAWSHCNSRVWLRVKGLKLRILVSPLAAHFKLSAAQSPQSEEEEWYMAQVVKWILKYLRGTSNACLEFGRNTNTSVGFVDSDYESRIAIIIFSKNYASSRWCLDELTKIMECVDNNGTTVFPVFLDIDHRMLSELPMNMNAWGCGLVVNESNPRRDTEYRDSSLLICPSLGGLSYLISIFDGRCASVHWNGASVYWNSASVHRNSASVCRNNASVQFQHCTVSKHCMHV
ncbi:hypothetical protein FXO37_16033 [Capsicum annuum]|nr:hypothetical protein FXO37_16033 [Capsicum annuum]